MPDYDVKAHARERFGELAQNYVHSPIHALGDDLDRLMALANPQPDWTALDVATGGGHTALKLAGYVRSVIASDFGMTMLGAAQGFITSQNAANVQFCGADAEHLPFADESFDLVTCRIAAHHFGDIYRFALEAARVLKPGGTLAINDHLLPNDKRAMAYIEAFDRLRDPSHNQALNEYEWRGTLLDAGLTVGQVEHVTLPTRLLDWARRQNCSADVIERLHILLAQAPRAVAEWIRPRNVGSPDAEFDHVFILITGHKPAER